LSSLFRCERDSPLTGLQLDLQVTVFTPAYPAPTVDDVRPVGVTAPPGPTGTRLIATSAREMSPAATKPPSSAGSLGIVLLDRSDHREWFAVPVRFGHFDRHRVVAVERHIGILREHSDHIVGDRRSAVLSVNANRNVYTPPGSGISVLPVYRASQPGPT
jgi:hypothetical protein